MQAAILEVKLRFLDRSIARRQRIAARYNDALRGLLNIPVVKSSSTHSYYLYVVRHPERDRVVAQLRERGIEIGIHFPHPIHLMEAYQVLGYRAGSLPVTERMAREVFSLPMYPSLTDADIEAVIVALREILS